MRTEQQILADQTEALNEYRANVHDWSEEQVQEHNALMRKLRQEMRVLYIQGAKVHPFIAEYAKDKEIPDPLSLIYAHKASDTRFEIACDIDGITFRSRGFDQESAVRNWNEGKWYWSTAQIESGRVPAFVIEELEAKNKVEVDNPPVPLPSND